MDKPFIAYAGIDKITIGNGRNGKAYGVSVELAAAAPALLEALEFAESALFYARPHMLEHGRMWDTTAVLDAIDKARAAIAQARGK